MKNSLMKKMRTLDYGNLLEKTALTALVVLLLVLVMPSKDRIVLSAQARTEAPAYAIYFFTDDAEQFRYTTDSFTVDEDGAIRFVNSADGKEIVSRNWAAIRPVNSL